jgi:RNA polymerase sigma-70 factor (ECF subfamily)
MIPRLRAYAKSLVRNSTVEADDLVHDAVAEMLSCRAGYVEGNFAAWAFTIQRRLFWRGVRSAMRNPERQDPAAIENDDTLPACLISVPNQDDWAQLREVERAIGLLPAHQREVLHLVAMEGLGYRQIAEILQESESAVKSRIHHARRAIERFLLPDTPDQPNVRRLGNLPGAGPKSVGTVSTAGFEMAGGVA